MNDLIAVKAMCHRPYWLKYSHALLKIDNLQPEIKLLLGAIRDYYQRYPSAEDITSDELEVFFRHLNPTLRSPELYSTLFTTLRTVTIGNKDLVVDVLGDMMARHTAAQMGMTATQVVQEQVPSQVGMDTLQQLLTQYRDVVSSVNDNEFNICRAGMRELLDPSAEASGVPFRLRFMREGFGNLSGATLGHIFARPDAGKTSFALNQTAGFIHHFRREKQDKVVLYLQNEEDIYRVKTRAMCAMFQLTPNQLYADLEAKETIWDEHYDHRVKFGSGVNDIYQVERYIARFKPAVVIIDQGPKVSYPMPNKNANGVERLQKLYNRFRELAKEYGPDIITLGQADNNASNRKYLALNNLDQSKVAIQGELDWAIGIGFLEEPGYEAVRYLSIVKNKLRGVYLKDQVVFDASSCTWKE